MAAFGRERTPADIHRSDNVTEQDVKAANRRLYDAIAGRYDELDGRRVPTLAAWLRGTLAAVRRRAPGGRLLDLGAGTGLVARAASGIFDLRVGLDISPRMLAAGRQAFDLAVAGDVDRLPFADASFDAVTCFAVLHHLYGFDALAREAARVLAPGGIFYSDHDLDAAFFRRFRPLLAVYRLFRNASARCRRASSEVTKEVYDLSERHGRGLDAEGVARVFRHAGFAVETRFHWFGLSGLTDRLFGAKARGRGWAPLVSLVAEKGTGTFCLKGPVRAATVTERPVRGETTPWPLRNRRGSGVRQNVPVPFSAVKVALYIPPIPDENTTPHLGPLYLAAVLEQDGFDVRVFDARIDRTAFRKLAAFGPDVLGVSAVTPGHLGGLRAAAKLKEICPGVRTVFGGPHPSALPEQVAAEPAVDYVLVGEAESTFLDLCRRLRDGAPIAGNGLPSPDSLREVRNLAFKAAGRVLRTDSAGYLSPHDLDALPMPAFHLMDLAAYFAGTQTHGLFHRGRRILPVMSARGCPHSCTFCCRVMGSKIRSRSVESVMAEVRFLADRYGIDEVYFEDDNFTVQRGRALELLDRLAAFQPPIHVKFANGVRGDLVDRELLEAMKRARVYSLSFGIESGCPATLQKMKKHLDLDRARENVILAKSMGFLVGANCIIGYPGETVEEIEASLGFFLRLPLDSMAIVNLVPFPGTEVRAVCEREGWLTAQARDWDNYYFAIGNPIPLIATPQLPADALVRAVRRAYRRMYLRPRWLARAVRQVSLRQLLRGGAALLGLRGKGRAREVEGLDGVEPGTTGRSGQ